MEGCFGGRVENYTNIKEEVDTHFILDGASGNDDIISIWISHKILRQ
jgi:hypothetical protein